jgi:hypothetical protein
MRAMMSVGPLAGNPTTTRTVRVGYPSAIDGFVPDTSNAAIKMQSKTRVMALPLAGLLLIGRHHRR